MIRLPAGIAFLTLIACSLVSQNLPSRFVASDWTPVPFLPGSSQPIIYPDLVRLAKLLKEHPDFRVTLAGNCDSHETADNKSADRLSLARATAVKGLLVSGGVSPNQISIQGEGKRNPAESNATPEGRFMNRRVNITVSDASGHVIGSERQNDVLPDFQTQQISRMLQELAELQSDQQMLIRRPVVDTAELKQQIRTEISQLRPEASPSAGLLRLYGRAFMIGGIPETAGYGVYTYLLIPSEPVTTEQHQLCVRAVKAFLRVGAISEIEVRLKKLVGSVDHRELSIAYLPVKTTPIEYDADAILRQSYDYSLASLLLKNIVGKDLTGQAGPFLVSSLERLSQHPSSYILLQDFTGKKADGREAGDLIEVWATYCLAKTLDRNTWNRTTFRDLAFKFQAELERMAEAFGPSVQGVKSVISLIDMPSAKDTIQIKRGNSK